MKRIKLGDVFAINTPSGKAFIHYIFRDANIGDLIRVLPGIYAEIPGPTELQKIADSQERYFIFFPLTYAYKRKIVDLVGSCPFEGFAKPKYMRTTHIINGEFLGWHIVDTDTLKLQLVKKLTEKQKCLSPWGIWNDTLLIERLNDNWTLNEWS